MTGNRGFTGTKWMSRRDLWIYGSMALKTNMEICHDLIHYMFSSTLRVLCRGELFIDAHPPMPDFDVKTFTFITISMLRVK